jgi:hypothetical protein
VGRRGWGPDKGEGGGVEDSAGMMLSAHGWVSVACAESRER